MRDAIIRPEKLVSIPTQVSFNSLEELNDHVRGICGKTIAVCMPYSGDNPEYAAYASFASELQSALMCAAYLDNPPIIRTVFFENSRSIARRAVMDILRGPTCPDMFITLGSWVTSEVYWARVTSGSASKQIFAGAENAQHWIPTAAFKTSEYNLAGIAINIQTYWEQLAGVFDVCDVPRKALIPFDPKYNKEKPNMFIHSSRAHLVRSLEKQGVQAIHYPLEGTSLNWSELEKQIMDVGIMCTPTDALVSYHMKEFSRICAEIKRPIYATNLRDVVHGASLGSGSHWKEIGRKTAWMVIRHYVYGKKLSDIGLIKKRDRLELRYNLKALKKHLSQPLSREKLRLMKMRSISANGA